MASVLLFVVIVAANNVLPAFGPPTWAIVVYFAVREDVPLVALVPLGAAAAATGRVTLALLSRRLRGRLRARSQADLDALRERLVASRGSVLGALALFVVSPLPSAQLFVAAGLAKVPLAPLAAAFFVGRLGSYTIYGSAASLAADQVSDILTSAFSTPWGIALQVLLIAGIVALVRVPWARLLTGRRHRDTPAGPA